MTRTKCSGICAIITTYSPDYELPNRVERVLSQLSKVVIIDDSNSLDNITRLSRWFSNNEKVHLHHNESNLGIAASLNNGIAIAKRAGYSFVLTLDDDTLIYPNMVQTLLDYWKEILQHSSKPIALMGMLYQDTKTGELSDSRTSVNGLPYSDKREIITSGSLMALEAFESIGPFRTDFFIDFVDYDYCFRARAAGYRVIKIYKVGMEHSVGQLRLCKFAGKVVETYNHSPARLYYYFRNSIVFFKEVFITDPLFGLALLWGNLRTAFLVTLFETQKIAKISSMFRGLIDGCRNRLGRTVAPS